MDLTTQLIWLFTLALPIACVSWTVTHEEIFAEPRGWCQKMSTLEGPILRRKFFYVFTCEYCFSFYVTLFFLWLTEYKLLFDDNWRGYFLALFALVWVANIYMSLFFRIRITIKKEGLEAKIKDEMLKTE